MAGGKVDEDFRNEERGDFFGALDFGDCMVSSLNVLGLWRFGRKEEVAEGRTPLSKVTEVL